MTKIKLCGLSRSCDIETANELHPEYVGFVFAANSRRYVTHEQAAELKKRLASDISAVGVFVNESVDVVAELLRKGTVDIAQLHGDESEEYIAELKRLTDNPVIKAFRVKSERDIELADKSVADCVLLDSGAGTGSAFDWNMIKNIRRPYFLAGGLDIQNVSEAVKKLSPYAVDVSSGIETDGVKDKKKMADFVFAVRKEG